MNKPRTVESPTTLLTTAMNSCARLSQRTRRILEGQLREIERELKSPGLQPGRRLELLDALLTAMTALDRSANESVKLLKGAPPTPTDAPSVEQVLQEIKSGVRR